MPVHCQHKIITPTIPASAPSTIRSQQCPRRVDDQALRAGELVLCEKPLANNADEAVRMAAVAQETGQPRSTTSISTVGMPLCTPGQRNLPCCKRFTNRHHPDNSWYKIFVSVADRLRKTERCPERGAFPRANWASAAKQMLPHFRRSVGASDSDRLVDCSAAPHCATVPHMESIGVRQLQQNAATTVERVRRGESIEVTVRGRPVAKLVPVDGSLLEQLEAAGKLTRATGNLNDLGPPRVKMPRGESASARLARMRDDER
jgi:prevent-host-death family protein